MLWWWVRSVEQCGLGFDLSGAAHHHHRAISCCALRLKREDSTFYLLTSIHCTMATLVTLCAISTGVGVNGLWLTLCTSTENSCTVCGSNRYIALQMNERSRAEYSSGHLSHHHHYLHHFHLHSFHRHLCLDFLYFHCCPLLADDVGIDEMCVAARRGE